MGTLFVVGTPIGNLKDITYRAVETLRKVDFIACEDTRRTAILLNHYEIKKPLVSYHQHSKLAKIDEIVGRLSDGEDGALVSDAGTPVISDPGGMLVEKAIEAGINVSPIPGPSAVTAILSVAGVPADEFVFMGYLPKKKGRETTLTNLKNEKRTIVIYESPERIEKTLLDLEKFLNGDKEVIIGRELTKVFEEIIRGKLREVVKNISRIKRKGEFVLCVR